jgi:hypothetical protein
MIIIGGHMEDLLFTIDFTPQIIYLTLILIIIGNALKDIPFIQKWMIIWILMFISIFVEFIFINITFESLFEAVISTSLSTTIYQLYKQAKKGIRSLHIDNHKI